jgi:hypothetical protein
LDPTAHELDDLPPALAARLKRADRAEVIFDPRTDRAVIERARRYFASRPRTASPVMRWGLPFAAAAAVALLVVLPFVPRGGGPDDVDGSGSVDVLDVFALARQRAAQGDASGIDTARIEALAARIVALDPPRSRR